LIGVTVGDVLYDILAVTLVALVFVGAIPLVVATYQFARVGLHRWFSHLDKAEPYLPRVAIVIPAWNEGAVLGASLDRLLGMDYPPESLRLYVVDDASTDDTPEVVGERIAAHPGRVLHLRREQGGQGKAHTLNHGLRIVLADHWAEAVLIMDADVVYEQRALRYMTRHLADPGVGAVTAYIKEGSQPANWMNKFISFEYIAAQAAARRGQNTIGVLACLAGGAQLHSRENIEAIGGQIDTSSLAEDTFTTFFTQIRGKRVVFDGNAVVWAEEPRTIDGLWKQRLRWARGNVQVTSRFRHLWFRRSKEHNLGSFMFGLTWFSLFLLPLLMITSSAALVGLFFLDPEFAWPAFRWLWIINAISYLFITSFTLVIDPTTARRCWVQAIMFPGLISLLLIAYSCFPRPVRWAVDEIFEAGGFDRTHLQTRMLLLFAYTWISLCMLVAWAAHELEKRAHSKWFSRFFVYLGGYGAVLCAISFTSYVKELRGAEMKWDKTEKTGTVVAG
jgi:cellulose synthase/poly-beta-1,6-N-acetylglucosamine synthase-like glycosyltransferase